MNQSRAISSPDLVSPSTRPEHHYDDSALEGVAANIKLLLKLTQDHKEACDKEKNDSRRMLRVATMMTILDNVRDRIQKCQSFGNIKRTSEAELRRCNTDLRRNPIPRDKRNHHGIGGEPVVEDEKERLKRELAASLAARKSLQVMCSSLGKEKEIMACELSKKVHEMCEMEELIEHLKERNNTLLQKVQECASEHYNERRNSGGGLGGGGGGGQSQAAATAALQERNKVLSEQLLKSLDGYRAMKRRLKLVQEENVTMHGIMDEMGGKVVISIERVRRLRERMNKESEPSPGGDFRREIEALERMFERFRTLVEKRDKNCVIQHKGEINACKPPSVLA
ncbi:hypothetical protein ABFX02_08G125400 [Erythranthe guttata]